MTAVLGRVHELLAAAGRRRQAKGSRSCPLTVGSRYFFRRLPVVVLWWIVSATISTASFRTVSAM